MPEPSFPPLADSSFSSPYSGEAPRRYATGSKWLLASLFRYRSRLIAGTLFVFASVGFGTLVPRFVGQAIDGLRQEGLSDTILWQTVGIIIGTSLLSGIFLYLQRRTLINMSRYIEYDLRQDFYGHLQQMPLSFYQDQRIGDLMARATNDLGAVRQIVGPAIMYSEQTIFRVILILPVMYGISPKLTLLLLLTMPLVSLTVKYFGQQIHLRFEKIQEFFSEITARAQENLTGVRVVRAYSRERAEEAVFESLNRQYIDRNLGLVRLSAAFYPLMQFCIGLGFALILVVGGYEAAQGRMTLGEFAAFHLYLEQLIWPLVALGYVTNLVQRGTASLKRMQEVMVIDPAIKDDSRGDGTPAPDLPLRGRIEFRHLTFRYRPELPPALDGIDLVIEPGQTVAFIGRTGSGKSTLLNLLPRLFDAEPGMIWIDDRPIRQIPLASLRRQIGYVQQETFLFSETLAENIAYGASEQSAPTPAEIEAVAEIAGLAEDVRSFPAQFQTVLGERGITLSGGQKQRTAIARAILPQPRILLLDDALSAVDTYTEEKILSRLRQVMRQRTTLIVAHRISTVRHADLICVLDQGRIVERGTHDQLMALGGLYTDLHERQRLEEELAAG